MKKIVLIDGNSFVFRAYYATAFTGSILKTKDGVATNALMGFVNFVEAIIKNSQCDYVFVALDKGSQTFRKKIFDDYKAQRDQAPSELVSQFKLIREYLTLRNITWLEDDEFEADDIIGSIAYKFHDEYEVELYTGDQDYLQLLSDNIKVNLIKKGGLSQSVVYNQQLLEKDYGVSPKTFIDLKAICGDKSDNIPGIAGIGEKTALKYLQKYETLENLYENIENEKPTKTREKFQNDKENAFLSKHLATIVTDHDFNISLNDMTKNLSQSEELKDFFTTYELNSLVKRLFVTEGEKQEVVKQVPTLKFSTSYENEDIEFAYIISNKEDSYHLANIEQVIAISKDTIFLINKSQFNNEIAQKIFTKTCVVFDSKRTNMFLNKLGLDYVKFENDVMLMSYVIDSEKSYALISKYNHDLDLNVDADKELFKNLDNNEFLETYAHKISEFFVKCNLEFKPKLTNEQILKLYNMELDLSYVLYKMEKQGIKFNSQTNKNLLDQIQLRLDSLCESIYKHAGCEFNINSPKQLGEVLFEQMKISYPKKKTTKSYTTSVDVLEKLIFEHEIIMDILEYRKLNKLTTTYLNAFDKFKIDTNIHTVYNQCGTTTGRLSSNYPNLQNIPIRTEIGKKVRQAFESQENYTLVAIDYSQIELRVIAAIAQEKHMLDAFEIGYDIHKDTASKVLNINYDDVTTEQRKIAKAINFGIIYGMGAFKLAQDLNISQKEAKEFIEKYHQTYANITKYIENTIVSAHENEYVKTYFNRIRYLKQINERNKMIQSLNERIAINSPIQGTAADIIKLAMIQILKEFDQDDNCRLLLQIHDELIFEIQDDMVEKLSSKIINIMENIVDLGVKLECNVKTGKNWYLLK